MADEEIRRTTDDARAGETRGRVRWILVVSTVVLAAVFLWIAFGTPTNPGNMTSEPAPASETG